MVQGANETVIALVSTVFGFAAGAIIAGFGWAVLAVVSIRLLVAASAVFLKEVRRTA